MYNIVVRNNNTKEDEIMTLSEVLNGVSKCQIPELQDYSTLNVIRGEEFYYPSPLIETHTTPDSKVIIFSAPGAVGKTALAKHIAQNYGGLYWNVGLKQIGSTAFAGEITHAVGVGHGSQQDDLYQKLQCGKALFVLDSFDEAALISRREGIKDFLSEIGGILEKATAPSIIMTARTEMAQFLRSVCDEIGLHNSCYEIDYFEEKEAFQFIINYLKFNGVSLNNDQSKNIEAYINAIKLHLGGNDPKPFIGYAQVLCIIARQIEVEYKQNFNLENLSSHLHTGSEQLIYSIIQQLISREKSKLDPFRKSICEKYKQQNNCDLIDSLYCKQEQLIRLQFLVLTGSEDCISIDDYAPCDKLLPEDKSRYLELLKDWLPQHVFLHNKTIMPIFSDYLLAESLLNNELDLFAGEYQSKLPTRVFLDCYLSINNNCVKSEHIYYLDLAFAAQASTGNPAYCDIGNYIGEEDDTEDEQVLYLTLTSGNISRTPNYSLRIIREPNSPICLCRAENISVSVDGKVVLAPGFLNDVTIRKSSIECDELELNASEIIFESYEDEENHIVVHKSVTRKPGGKIILKGTKKLKIELPRGGIDLYKRQFYEFSNYLTSISSDTGNLGGCDSIEQYVYGLKKVLEQFKIDRYGGDPAKHKEKIDARCHTGTKSRVLAFLKSVELLYEDGIMYKASLSKMDSLRISRVAYISSDCAQLQYSYDLYCKWFTENYG